DDWNTCAARPSGSATSPTTSHDRSSRPADSDPTYTLDPDEPLNPLPARMVSISDHFGYDVGFFALLLPEPPFAGQWHLDTAGGVRAGHCARPDPRDHRRRLPVHLCLRVEVA